MRAYHSASSVKLGARCERAWAYRYIDGLTQPGTPATELGTAVHATLESWYRGAPTDWSSPAGVIAHSGVHLLPDPSVCRGVAVESSIGDYPIGDLRALEAGGVMWVGYRDLLVADIGAEAARLGVPADSPLLVDHKTSSSIARYMPPVEDLRGDVQACLYALSAPIGTHLRWVYMQTRGAQLAVAQDIGAIGYADAMRVIAPAAALARHLDLIPSSADAPQNTEACGDYGGCPYHRSKGGPCDARMRIYHLLPSRSPMPIDPETMAKFARAKAARTPLTAPTDDTPAPAAPPRAALTLDDTPAPVVPAPRRRAPRAVAPAALAPPMDPAERILAETQALANAQAALTEAQAAADRAQEAFTAASDALSTARDTRDAILARMREALA